MGRDAENVDDFMMEFHCLARLARLACLGAGR
jgi:hypothetical protein